MVITRTMQKCCLGLLFSCILSGPVAAENLPPTSSVQCAKSTGSSKAIICNMKGDAQAPFLQEDMYNAGLFGRALRNTTPDSAEQKQVIAGQWSYLKERDACGTDTSCIMRVMKARHKVLIALNQQLRVELPDAGIALFAGKAYLIDADDHDPQKKSAQILLSDRIFDAFEQDPVAHAKLSDGSIVFWGFQQGNGSVRSIVISNTRGEVQLIGAVDDLPEISRTPMPTAKTILAASPAKASGQVLLFVHNAKALQYYLPAVDAWARANLLGFNVRCNQNSHWQTLCKQARAYPLPIRAYQLACKSGSGPKNFAERCPLPLPKSHEQVSLELFRQ